MSQILMSRLSRRSWLQVAGLGSLAGGAAVANSLVGTAQTVPPSHEGGHGTHAMGTVGRVAPDRFDPKAYLRSWNFSHLPETERRRFYRETAQPNGTLLREYEFFAVDRE